MKEPVTGPFGTKPPGLRDGLGVTGEPGRCSTPPRGGVETGYAKVCSWRDGDGACRNGGVCGKGGVCENGCCCEKLASVLGRDEAW